MERKTEDVVMRTCKMEVIGHRKIGRPKRRWSDVIRKAVKKTGVQKHKTAEHGVRKLDEPASNREKVEEEQVCLTGILYSTNCGATSPMTALSRDLGTTIHSGKLQQQYKYMTATLLAGKVQQCQEQYYTTDHEFNKEYI